MWEAQQRPHTVLRSRAGTTHFPEIGPSSLFGCWHTFPQFPPLHLSAAGPAGTRSDPTGRSSSNLLNRVSESSMSSFPSFPLPFPCLLLLTPALSSPQCHRSALGSDLVLICSIKLVAVCSNQCPSAGSKQNSCSGQSESTTGRTLPCTRLSCI